MLCPQCSTPLEDGATFCGNCGARIAMPQSRDATVISDKTVPDVSSRGNNAVPVNSRYGPSFQDRTALDDSYLQTRLQSPVSDAPAQKVTPPLPSRSWRGNSRRNILIVLIVLVLVAGGTISAVLFLKNKAASGSGASGQVLFFDNQNGPPGHTDALSISINGLSAPSSGSRYDAWIINDSGDQFTPLGTLTGNGQKFSLNYTGPTGSRQQNTNLLGLGNRLEITLEQGQVTVPSGTVVLSGAFPHNAFVHIRHLLFAFPTTPGNIGLLVGVRNETKLLNGQALILQNIAAGGNQVAIQCAAQSIIDISEGTSGPHYSPLSAECFNHNITETGDGFGLLGKSEKIGTGPGQGHGYISTAKQHAILASIQTDSTSNIKTHAKNVETAMDNINGWVTTVDQDALKLLANPTDTSVVQEMVNLSDHAYHGVDTNGDGQVDPVAGEAGAITAYIQGQLMATLPLSSS